MRIWKTPFEALELIKKSYHIVKSEGISDLVIRTKSKLSGLFNYSRYDLGERFFRIQIDGVGEFEMFLPFGGEGTGFESLAYKHTDRIFGEYEPEVMNQLLSEITKTDCFWEIGAQYGYFSLAMATVAECVISVEAIPENVSTIKKSAEKNGFENINAVQGKVGGEITLDNLLKNNTAPDLILMDIEGWELNALRGAEELLSQDTTWIIECHRKPQPGVEPDGFSSDNVDEIIDLLSSSGYDICYITQDSGDNNFHLIATQDN